ncbi:esterase [Propionigenium maris DSM 9537]|uniref:Esterase n=1 Tax=Propionigenium maris DSM 9537 TaxID=1123000 RepID=A0A9W6GNM7_9FUSO|nr:thioesterase family protein [Propionigenium maris]GLI57086.1 esterase [Propionigenium maris DSM 9537]
MFVEEYKVTVGDINYGGHMGNERALVAFHQGRIAWLNSMGYSELNIGEGIGIIQRESKVEYLKEAFMGDILSVRIADVILKRSSFRIKYEIKNQRDEVIIIGDTLMIAFDSQRKKIVSLPKEFREKVERSIENNMD